MTAQRPPGGSAVVFDLDGVLIDSEPLWDEVRRGLAASAGRPWPPGATRGMQGMSTREWSTYLAEEVGLPGPPAQLAEQVIDAVAERYATRLPLLPGAVEVVRRLAARWPVALASSAPRRLIDTVLPAAGLADAFVTTISTEEVAAGKPSPVVYLEAVRRLGTSPADTVAIEDSTNGLRSAAAAGLVVIAVPQERFAPVADALALAATVVHALSAITVDLVESLLAGRRT
jgi:HAD superfamily hydrolase (TIGR01509 family)